MKTIIFILAIFISQTAFIPVQKNEFNCTVNIQDEREQIAKAIVENLSTKKYEEVRSYFAPSLKEMLTAEKMAQPWEGLVYQIGNFKKIVSMSKSEVQGYNVIKVKCEFEKDNFNVEITFRDDNKVIGLYLKP